MRRGVLLTRSIMLGVKKIVKSGGAVMFFLLQLDGVLNVKQMLWHLNCGGYNS